MLLEMRFSNFFSIKDEVCIDFKAGNINTAGAKELSDNIFSFNDETLLKVQGLFGPNASGKSSILKAAFFCRQLVIDSSQNNEKQLRVVYKLFLNLIYIMKVLSLIICLLSLMDTSRSQVFSL